MYGLLTRKIPADTLQEATTPSELAMNFITENIKSLESSATAYIRLFGLLGIHSAIHNHMFMLSFSHVLTLHRTNEHVALKILTADSFGGEKDTFELDILRYLASKAPGSPGANHIVGLQDEFKHSGPNGRHVCLVFKPMGPDMSHYRKLFSRAKLPLPVAKKVTRELLTALAFLHDSCQVIHTGLSNPLKV